MIELKLTGFKQEFKAVLEEFEIPYEDQYLFEELK